MVGGGQAAAAPENVRAFPSGLHAEKGREVVPHLCQQVLRGQNVRQRPVVELPEIGKQRFAAMPPQRRTIFALSRQENLSRQEIARRLGVSVRTVDKHLELALREIRLRIKDFQWVLLLFLFR